MKKVFCFLFLLSVFLFPTFSQINLISPIKGTWANKQMLVIQVAENEEYLYSLDGTDPEEFGFAYDGPVLLDTTGDIKLRIKKLGNSKEEKIVEFSVKTDDGFNKSYEQFISMFLDEGYCILKSQASRGIDYYASGIKGKFLAVKSMLIPMYIQTVHKIDLMAESMQVRLYNINNKRTNFKKAKWGFFDTFLLLIHLGILGLIIARMVI